jgi:hypothetical protein
VEDILSMKKEYGMGFIQSSNDFPLMVSLGGKAPDWELSRLGCPLRFGAFDDESFAVRGNSKRLLYKGYKRSHRFTILNDNHFEYDVILKKEPDTNVIELYIDGAGNYDFYRQPDFVSNDFLKGSYAVYRKDRIIGYGTGKLCHIHRPKIIDARGRWVWGDLFIAGNKLLITIPETWLADARYPVIVDPVVGCNTIGTQTQWDPWFEGELYDFDVEESLFVNRFYVNQTVSDRNLTAYYYSRYEAGLRHLGGLPLLYSENARYPKNRLVQDGTRVDFYTRNGWADCDMYLDTIPANGSYVWFGLKIDYEWLPCFDYGGELIVADGYRTYQPAVFPTYSENYEMILSMYFGWGPAVTEFVRVIANGVSISDNQKRLAQYARKTSAAVALADIQKQTVGLFRNIFTALDVADALNKLRSVFVFISDTASPLALIVERVRTIPRFIADYVYGSDIVSYWRGILRNITNTIRVASAFAWVRCRVRTIVETVRITHKSSKKFDYIRVMDTKAHSIAETKRRGDFHRFNDDALNIPDNPIRSVGYFIKIFTTSFIRDYVLSRFLVSQDEIKLKSRITSEIILNSTIR